MKKLFLLIALLFSCTIYGQDSVFVDCNGTPAPENWLGDGWCDNGAYTFDGNPIFFDCEEFGYDLGDCPLPIDTVFGCTNDLALNYDSLATVEDFTCEFPIFGCTDPEAPNFNPWAEADNGSCVGVSCSDGEVKMILELTRAF